MKSDSGVRRSARPAEPLEEVRLRHKDPQLEVVSERGHEAVLMLYRIAGGNTFVLKLTRLMVSTRRAVPRGLEATSLAS